MSRLLPICGLASLLAAALAPAARALEPGESEALRELESLAPAAQPPEAPEPSPVQEARPADGFTPEEHAVYGGIVEGLKVLETCPGAPQERIKGCLQGARSRIDQAGRWGVSEAGRNPAYGSPSGYETAVEVAQGLDACVRERDEAVDKGQKCSVNALGVLGKTLAVPLFFLSPRLGAELWSGSRTEECDPYTTVEKRTILEVDKGCLSSAAGKLRDSIPAPILEGLAGLAAPIAGETGTSSAVVESKEERGIACPQYRSLPPDLNKRMCELQRIMGGRP